MLSILMRPWVASCHETSERLSDFVDGELEGRPLVRVRKHLSRCDRCRAVLRSLTRVVDELRSLGRLDQAPPAPVTVRAVLERIERGER